MPSDSTTTDGAGHQAGGSSCPEVTLPGTEQFDLASTFTGRSHRILVSGPATPAPASGHPALYLLDGNVLFPSADALARIAAHAGQRLGIDTAPPVVVGIGHGHPGTLFDPARAEDYTPPAPDLSDTGDRAGGAQGGADRFLDFIEQELQPRIEECHPLDRNRLALAGHSYGGLFVLHALFTRPELFQGYIAGSPSIWWNHRFILTEKDRFSDRAATGPWPAGKRLLITVGEREQPPVRQTGGEARDDAIRARRMIDSARRLAEELAALPTRAGLEVAFHEIPGANHIDAALAMLPLAFDFLRRPVA